MGRTGDKAVEFCGANCVLRKANLRLQNVTEQATAIDG